MPPPVCITAGRIIVLAPNKCFLQKLRLTTDLVDVAFCKSLSKKLPLCSSKRHRINKSIRIHIEGSGRNAYPAITAVKGNVLLSSHAELCQCLTATSRNNVLLYLSSSSYKCNPVHSVQTTCKHFVLCRSVSLL